MIRAFITHYHPAEDLLSSEIPTNRPTDIFFQWGEK